ncbi:TetR/AcrR family transcriptional regulator [Amycolatopsis anabasis]|uniref:TetR/AcrR family transcriptional regulator n=1 Tax=Amycolatopsis anabasis TaxID=1840409 RepID=UPI001FEB0D8B|nr:TetR/AcrR family transcriptional regulator [Amycolatopsis anabasis]
MAGVTGDRIALIGDTALEVIARDGMRGLTHRAVDRAAGLPAGSTSYYARTRLALLELAVARIVELDHVELDPPEDVAGFAEYIARFVHGAITAGRLRMIARYEFALEATRREELRAIYDRAGQALRVRAAEVLARVGSAEPERHARMLVTWCDGLIFDSVAGAGSKSPPSLAELTRSTRDLLAAILRHPAG